LVLIVCFIGYILLSSIMMLFLAPGKTGQLESTIGMLLHHLILSWLIFYSIGTINEMKWARDTLGEDK
jgi:hypothetical protein